MARLKPAGGLLVDRHYRGAVLMAGGRHFAVPEAVIAFVERVARAAGGHEPQGALEQQLADALVARGILEVLS